MDRLAAAVRIESSTKLNELFEKVPEGINRREVLNNTLFDLLQHGQRKFIRTLLNLGADPSALVTGGMTLREYAAKLKNRPEYDTIMQMLE